MRIDGLIILQVIPLWRNVGVWLGALLILHGQAEAQTQLTAIERGRIIVADRDKASCLLCHKLTMFDDEFQGNIGPPLMDLRSRYNAKTLKQRLMFPQRDNPNSPMPVYYRDTKQWTQTLSQVDPAYQGKNLYTKQELNDVIAFLLAETHE